MPVTTAPGPTIPAGQSLSNGIDLSAGQLILIVMPPLWTPATLSFKVSTDGSGYNDLYLGGNEVLFAVGPDRAIMVNVLNFPSLVWLQFRSGKSGFEVKQAQDAVFSCELLTATP